MPGETVLYHGSLAEFDPESFRPMSHFGTIRAALQRAGELLSKKNHEEDGACAFIYPVRLAIRSLFRITDGQNMKHGPCAMADALFYGRRKLLSAEERDRVLSFSSDTEAAFVALAGIVREKGYDGFVYKNRYEDKGRDSFVALDASSITPDGDPSPISLHEIISWLRKMDSPQAKLTAEAFLKDRQAGVAMPRVRGMEI